MPVSQYLRDLRAVVGHRLIMVPTTVAIIQDGEGRLLVGRLRDGTRWGLPGGPVELDERPEEAVVREVLAETGFHVHVDGIMNVYGGPEFRFTFPSGDQVSYLLVAYRCSILSGEVKLEGGAVGELRYVTQPEVQQLAMPAWSGPVLRDVWFR